MPSTIKNAEEMNTHLQKKISLHNELIRSYDIAAIKNAAERDEARIAAQTAGSELMLKAKQLEALREIVDVEQQSHAATNAELLETRKALSHALNVNAGLRGRITRMKNKEK